MAQLAIKGHSIRGKEVIEILKMLSGKNQNNVYSGKDTFHYYFIDNEDGYIRTKLYTDDCWTKLTYKIFTLEEFIEKFPYKVGDKVSSKYLKNYEVSKMEWESVNNRVIYKLQGMGWYSADELQPYKEETMKDYLVTEEDYGKTLEVEQEYIDVAESLIKQLAESTHWKCKDFDSQKMIALFLKKNTSIITEKEDSIIVDIPKGYEFVGVDDDAQQIVFEKIKPKYPKSYEECCDILQLEHTFELKDLTMDEEKLIASFILLKRCRDAYWKIVGEQMGLGKPWEPDWDDENEFKYGLYHFRNRIMHDGSCINPTLLAFPTEEIRDTFYENFKDLIEQCKELL